VLNGSKLELVGQHTFSLELNNLLGADTENGTFQVGKTGWYAHCAPHSVGLKRNKNVCQCGNHGYVLFGHLRKRNSDGKPGWQYSEFDLDDWVEALKQGREVTIMEPEPRYICIPLD